MLKSVSKVTATLRILSCGIAADAIDKLESKGKKSEDSSYLGREMEKWEKGGKFIPANL